MPVLLVRAGRLEAFTCCLSPRPDAPGCYRPIAGDSYPLSNWRLGHIGSIAMYLRIDFLARRAHAFLHAKVH